MSVCLYVCLSVCMYPCTSPLLPSISRKQHGFSSVFAKRMSKNTEFCQIFGKRMQEAQASKKAGRGNRAGDPCFATPAPRRLLLVERHQIAARSLGVGGGPPPPPRIRRRVGGGVRGGGYPLSSLRCPTRRAMSADSRCSLVSGLRLAGDGLRRGTPARAHQLPPEGVEGPALSTDFF